MTNRRITKASKRRLTLFGTVSIFAVLYFGFCVLYNSYTVYTLKKEKNKLEEQYLKLQEEAEELKNDITKLSDENYLANYARENYLYSKDGEYIIKLDEQLNDTEEEMDSISSMLVELKGKVNNNYLIIGLSTLMLIIFIYILSKGRKKRKK